MTNERFLELCKQKVWEYERDKTNPLKTNPLLEDIFVVWSCKTLQNSKAFLSVKRAGALYYEFTMNGNDQEIYMDVYKKVEHITLDFEGEKLIRRSK